MILQSKASSVSPLGQEPILTTTLTSKTKQGLNKSFSSIPTALSALDSEDFAGQTLVTIKAYKKQSTTDISCIKNEEFVVLKKANETWCYVQRVSNGETGYLPNDVLDFCN